MACSMTQLWSVGNFYQPLRCLYLSVLPDDNANGFVALFWLSYYSLSSRILSSIAMISFFYSIYSFY